MPEAPPPSPSTGPADEAAVGGGSGGDAATNRWAGGPVGGGTEVGGGSGGAEESGGDAAAAAGRLREIGADPSARPVLVALDFDGTLAPLRDQPMTARVATGGEAVLARLAATPGVHLAIVSGRTMAQIPLLVGLPVGTTLVGSHGAERARVTATGLDREVVLLSDEQSDALASLGGRAAAIARGRDGVWVETKPAAVVVHTRLAAPDVAAVAAGEALALAELAGIHPLRGKDVVELPVLAADKGAAVAAVRDEVGAAVVVYAGDDVTDEHAFAVLRPGDVGIKVGPGTSAARFRLAAPDDLVATLVVLADALLPS